MQILKNFLFVMLGGAAGSALRYAFTLMSAALGVQTHWGTMVVNAIGSFLIGLLAATLSSQTWTLLLVVGVCGGFTTYSTFSLQTVTLFQQGNVATALMYILLTLIVCLGFTYLGWRIK